MKSSIQLSDLHEMTSYRAIENEAVYCFLASESLVASLSCCKKMTTSRRDAVRTFLETAAIGIVRIRVSLHFSGPAFKMGTLCVMV